MSENDYYQYDYIQDCYAHDISVNIIEAEFVANRITQHLSNTDLNRLRNNLNNDDNDIRVDLVSNEIIIPVNNVNILELDKARQSINNLNVLELDKARQSINNVNVLELDKARQSINNDCILELDQSRQSINSVNVLELDKARQPINDENILYSDQDENMSCDSAESEYDTEDDQNILEDESDDDFDSEVIDQLALKGFISTIEREDPPIYENAQVKYKIWSAMFIDIAFDSKVDMVGGDKLLKFFKFSMPQKNNVIPKTYKFLVNAFNFSNPSLFKICGHRYSTLTNSQICNKLECLSVKSLKKNLNKPDADLIKFDFVNDLRKILNKHWSDVLTYKEILRSGIITDICNSLLYNSMQLCHNSISVLLFFDGASFTKTGKGKL